MKFGTTRVGMILAIGCSAAMLQAGVVTQTLGTSAGFADGSTNARVGAWNTDTSGNPAPFNGFNGSDTTGTSFAADWAFGYGVITDTILSATLTIGIYDIDSAASPNNQVASYTEGSVDLTALLNAVSAGLNGATGAVNNEYDILTITLPSSTFADLAAGSPIITLDLQGPGLGTLGSTTSNGAGIDFSTITIDTQAAASPTPEPASFALLLAGLGSLAGRRWLRRA